MARRLPTLLTGDSSPGDNPYWTPEELASFATHPGSGRILNVRPGESRDTAVESCLREAGYCLGRLPITRDPSHLPLAAATFGPDIIYLTLEKPLHLCLSALETLAADEKTKAIPLVALVSEYAPSSVIEEAYTRAGCDFFRLGATEIELLARTHLLVRLANREPSQPVHQRPIPEAANAPVGARLDLRDPRTGLYTHTYLRHRLPTETARALRYQRDLSVAVVRCRAAADSNDVTRHIAKALRDSCRGVDLVARQELDLFVVVLPETDAEGSLTVRERIEDGLASLSVEYAIGMAHLGPSSSDSAFTAEALLQLASQRADVC